MPGRCSRAGPGLPGGGRGAAQGAPGAPERQAAATALQRAAEALAQRLCLAWLLYTPVPEGLWRRLHRLHATAERHALQAVTVADPLLPGREGSVHLTYARLLLVASAQPNRLRPPRCSPCTGPPGTGRAGWCCTATAVRRASGWTRKATRARARWPGATRRASSISTPPLAEALAGDGAASPLGDILLNQLRAVWLAAPDRARPRAASGESGLLVGLKAAHDGLERAGGELDPHPVRWLDRAEGGCRLAWAGATPGPAHRRPGGGARPGHRRLAGGRGALGGPPRRRRSVGRGAVARRHPAGAAQPRLWRHPAGAGPAGARRRGHGHGNPAGAHRRVPRRRPGDHLGRAAPAGPAGHPGGRLPDVARFSLRPD
ncbi:hypothetical protein HML84_16825 [Alcanivorax sp. IO_7]|nr:hypothetical protein HML84_16825 [Alcanivorax sp. IO_7]